MASRSGSTGQKSKMYQRVHAKAKKYLKPLLDTTQSSSEYLKIVSALTGMQESSLHAIESDKIVINTVTEIPRSVLHDALYRFYLDGKVMPTTKNLFEVLENYLPVYYDVMMLRKLLLNYNYGWKMIMGYGFVIVENPKVLAERYRYLKEITMYKEEFSVYYVKEIVIDSQFRVRQHNDDDMDMNRYIFCVSQTGIEYAKVENLDTETFERWVVEKLKPILKGPSVIVLDDVECHNGKLSDPPTMYSLKEDMLEWLYNNNIPCEHDMPKSELYSLIRDYTNTEIVYRVDSILNFHGHKVLRLPKDLTELSPAHLIYELIIHNIKEQNRPSSVPTLLNSILSSIDEPISEENYFTIEEKEIEMLKMEEKLDQEMDNLVSFMKDCRLVESDDSDIPSLSESE